MAKPYKLTPKRKQSLIKAARISAQRRHSRSAGVSKGNVGYWIAKGVKKAGDKSTLGVAGMVVSLKELNDQGRRRRGR